MNVHVGRCHTCGAPLEESQPELAQWLDKSERSGAALAEFRSRFDRNPDPALAELARSRGLPLATVVEYAARDRLAELIA